MRIRKKRVKLVLNLPSHPKKKRRIRLSPFKLLKVNQRKKWLLMLILHL